MINKEDVEKLASLSRMDLSEEEKESFAKEIDSIIGYVEKVGEVSSDSKGKNTFPDFRLRDDGEPHEKGKYTEEILKQSPDREGNYISVKKIL